LSGLKLRPWTTEYRDVAMTMYREPRDDGHVAVGRCTYHYGNPFVLYGPTASIEVGAFCSIAREAHILSGGEHAMDLPSTYPFRTVLTRADEGEWDIFAKGPTRLGNDVWVGFGATILGGSTIGHGAVVAARALVTGGDIPPYAIVAGNPARVVAHRFDPPTIERLLALRWWDWPDERIEALEPYFYAGVEVFLDEAESRFSSSASRPEVPTASSASGSPILSAAR
jgi:acetyltransferase-like isoleucine patch superfamily enzyme